MRILDLSQPIFDNCPNCPEHPPVRSEIIVTHAQAGWQVEKLTLSNHTASHVDAPLHKIAGAASLDDIPLERWVGPAYIADLRPSLPDHRFGAADLASRLPIDLRDKIVLLATGWGQKRAKTDEWLHHAPMVGADGAKGLGEEGIGGVGMDYYSIVEAA